MRRLRHKFGKPPKGTTDVLMLSKNGRWVKWDGKTRGKAFSGRSKGGWPGAWWDYATCDKNDRNGNWCRHYGADCPADRAMRMTCDRYGAANGRNFTEDL